VLDAILLQLEHLRLIAWFPPGHLPGAFGGGGAFGSGTAQAPLLGTLAVEFQEAGEDLVAEIVGPAVAPGLAPAAGWEFLVAGC